jgi:hypothetical protein
MCIALGTELNSVIDHGGIVDLGDRPLGAAMVPKVAGYCPIADRLK